MADPVQAEHHAVMNALAHGVDEALNGPRQIGIKPKLGFVLLVAEFGRIDGGRVNYISNGNREDMLAMCREYLARAEGRYQDPPSGKAN